MLRSSRGNSAFRLQNNLLYRDIIVTLRRRDFYFGSTRRGIDRHGDDGDHSSKVDLYLEYSEFSALITNHCPCFCCLVVQNVLHGHLFGFSGYSHVSAHCAGGKDFTWLELWSSCPSPLPKCDSGTSFESGAPNRQVTLSLCVSYPRRN